MPKPTTKSRQELRSRFVRNAIPSETDFADLIGASLNQADDGLLKLSDGSFGLVNPSQKPDQPVPVLRFFADPTAEGAVWQLQLGAGNEPSISLTPADGKPVLFIDRATGNIGIGTDKLSARLHISHTNQDPNGGALILGPTSQSNLRMGYDQNYSWVQSHGSKPLAINAIGNNVGIGTIAPLSKLQITGNASITSSEGSNIACRGGHMAPGSLTIGGIDTSYGGGTGWNTNTAGLLLETLDNTEIAVHDSGLRLASFMHYESTKNQFTIGRDMGWGTISMVNINGSTKFNGCITPSVGNNEGNGILFPKDAYGGSGDSAWIRYFAETGEACVLEIGISNDPNDYMHLKSSGGVRIDVLRLGTKWRFSSIGDAHGNDEWLRMFGQDTSPNAYYGGFAAGKFWTNTTYQTSDVRLKKDINKIESAIEKLRALQGISYTWKEPLEPEGKTNQNRLGLVAQEVALVFPELVETGPDNLLGVDYTGLIAVLIEGVKSQQLQIDRLEGLLSTKTLSGVRHQ